MDEIRGCGGVIASTSPLHTTGKNVSPGHTDSHFARYEGTMPQPPISSSSLSVLLLSSADRSGKGKHFADFAVKSTEFDPENGSPLPHASI